MTVTTLPPVAETDVLSATVRAPGYAATSLALAVGTDRLLDGTRVVRHDVALRTAA